MTNGFRRTPAKPLSIAGREARRKGADEVSLHTDVVVRKLSPRPGKSADATRGAVQWLEPFFIHLDCTRERVLLRLPFAADATPTLCVTITHDTAEVLARRKAAIACDIDIALSAALPGMRAVDGGMLEELAMPVGHAVELRPEGLKVDADSFKTLVPRIVASSERGPESCEAADAVWVARDLARRPDLSALALLMPLPELARATVVLELSRFKRDPRLERLLRRTYQPLADAVGQHAATDLLAKDGFGHAFMTHLAWLNAPACQRVHAWIEAEEPVSGVLAGMVCQAIYGVPTADHTPDGCEDLTRAWPDCNLAWLERLPALLAARRQHSLRNRLKSASGDGLRLGQLEDGSPLHLSQSARAQHAFIMGQTGTGKTTHIENLIMQDIERGDGVVLFDAHGDLARSLRHRVPDHRKADIVYVHPTDPDGRFTLNVFQPIGDNLEIEHERIASDLINLFKRVYPEPKEAYGPMYMQYTRNAIFLLLSALGAEANFLQISRIFHDRAFRRELISKCTREDVKDFWGSIASNVSDSGDYATIANVAPYITAKLTQLSGNQVLAPIIGATTTSLDFRRIVAEKQICIVNLDLPAIGEEGAKVLGGLLFSRLTAYLQMQGKLAAAARIPLRVYCDEVQTYADESLASSMAQMRKFGVSYTLACQHLAQLDGSGWRPDVARAVLGNVASILMFRLGFYDAHLLAPYVASHISPDELMRMPNYHAAARLIGDGGETLDPLIYRTDPPLG